MFKFSPNVYFQSLTASTINLLLLLLLLLLLHTHTHTPLHSLCPPLYGYSTHELFCRVVPIGLSHVASSSATSEAENVI